MGPFQPFKTASQTASQPDRQTDRPTWIPSTCGTKDVVALYEEVNSRQADTQTHRHTDTQTDTCARHTHTHTHLATRVEDDAADTVPNMRIAWQRIGLGATGPTDLYIWKCVSEAKVREREGERETGRERERERERESVCVCVCVTERWHPDSSRSPRSSSSSCTRPLPARPLPQ